MAPSSIDRVYAFFTCFMVQASGEAEVVIGDVFEYPTVYGEDDSDVFSGSNPVKDIESGEVEYSVINLMKDIESGEVEY